MTFADRFDRVQWRPPLIFICALLLACSKTPDEHHSVDDSEVRPSQGDLAIHGGTPTVRTPYYQPADDPATSNDESNDQPVGHFGTVTIRAYSVQSGNEYTLDADIDGLSVDRIYFPRGGWIDFVGCDVDEDLIGECVDEEGRNWEFRGESFASPSDDVEEEHNSDEDSGSDDVQDNEEEE